MKTLVACLTLCAVFTFARAAETTVSGAAFLLDGHKFAGMTVTLYPLDDALRALDTFGTPEMPKPLAKTVTDGDGKWQVKIPEGASFLLMASAQFHAKRADRWVTFEWRIKSTDVEDLSTVMLTDQNCQPHYGQVR